MNTQISPHGSCSTGTSELGGTGLFWPRVRKTWLVWVLLTTALVGCITHPAYKSLYTVGRATDSVVKGYFDSVAKGKIRTNGVPAVAKAYREFQSVYATALKAAMGNQNASPGADVIAKESEVFIVVNEAKAFK